MSVRGCAFLLLAMVSSFTATLSNAQGYPAKPIRILTIGAGGGTDTMARLVAAELTLPLGQSVIVENRPAGPPLAVAFAQSAPDGHTLMVNGSNLWIAPLLEQVPYDAVRDFAPIVFLSRVPSLLVVHPDLPVKTVPELIKLAKTKPGFLNAATGASGGSQHITLELFASMADIDIVRVAYKGGPQQFTDLASGRIHLNFGPPAAWGSLIKAGKVRAIASTGATRAVLFPDLPTVAETLPGYEAVGANAFFAPARTPDAIIRRLNQETVNLLKKPSVTEKILGGGLEPVGGSPEQLAATMKAEMARVGKLIKDAGIKLEN